MNEELRSYGLSEKEINIYLTCLKLGDSTTNRLSELSSIRRSTVYEVLESLKKKGLITSFRKEKKSYFTAIRPAGLLNLLKEKERQIQAILPELNQISSSIKEKPKVEMFEGSIGIKNALQEMLNYKEIFVYGASVVGDQVLGSYTANFAKKRVEKKVRMKAILEKNVPKHMIEKDVAAITEIRILPFLKNHNNVYFLYGNKMAVVTLDQELTALRITNNVLVESQKKLFSFMWNNAKKS